MVQPALACPASRLIQLQSRSAAGLQPFRRLLAIREPQGVVFHCSDGQQPRDTRHAAERLRIMQGYHRAPERWVTVTDAKGQPVLGRGGKPKRRNEGGRGWLEVGYSWAFDDFGNVWELRGWGVVGSHTAADPDGRGSLNFRAHGAVYLGDGERPTGAAIEAGAWLVEEHERRFGPGFVVGHCEVSSAGKTCPGRGVQERLVLPLGRPLMPRPGGSTASAAGVPAPPR